MRPQLNPLILGPGAPWSLPGSSLDIQFTTGRAAVNRQTSSISSLLTTTRASTGYASTSTGLLVNFAANIPRITDLGLLVEQAATNIILQSNTFSTTWATINSASVTANSATDPTNANNGWLLSSASNFGAVQQGVTIVSGTTYTASAFCKAGTTHVVAIEFRDVTSTNIVRVKADLNAGTVTGTAVAGSGVLVASGIIPFGNGWYRVWIAGTITSTAGGMAIGDNANAPINIDIFGAQLEASAFPTSYIPTTTVAVTRAADNIVLAGSAATAALAAKAAYIATNLIPVASVSSSRILDYSGGSLLFLSSSTTIRAQDSATHNADATIGGAGTVAGLVKSAFGLDNTSMTVISNGGAKATQATSAWATSATGTVTVGNRAAIDRALNGYISRIAFGSTKGMFDGLTT